MNDMGPTKDTSSAGKKTLHDGAQSSHGSKERVENPTTKKVDLYVVVADDDVDDHKLITKAVTDCSGNHLVTSVYNGLQLMNLLMRKGFYKVDFDRLPDIIILDLKMPVMDGYEALKKIRSNDKFKSIPVFVLSDSVVQEDIDKVYRLGADRFYTKPFSYEELKHLMFDICTEAVRLGGKREVGHP